jgi:hypothetical protein
MASRMCACNRRVEAQCPHGTVALVRVLYCVRKASGEASPLVIELGWWCLRSEDAALATDAQMIEALRQQRTVTAASRTLPPVSAYQSAVDPHADVVGRAREAASSYLTERIDSWLGGARLDDQLWASSARFLPGEAAQVADLVNNTMNDAVSSALENTLNAAGMRGGPAGVLSGITAKLVLEPFSEPIEEGRKTIEIVGLCISVVALQPSLAIACAKALLHEEITTLINDTISSLIDSVPAVSRSAAEDAHRAASNASVREILLGADEPGIARAVQDPGEVPPAIDGLSSAW